MTSQALAPELVVATPRDPVFDRWAAEELVWIPSRGMGRLCVTEAPYGSAYFEKYQEYAATPMGRAITAARAGLVRRHALGAEACDVGIGCGAFVEVAGGYGYDINPVGVSWLHERGLFLDPREQPCDVLTFWDSLEHIPDAADFIAAAKEWVFCSLPIVPRDGPPPQDWKHLRKDEHAWYWTHAGLLGWMVAQGFRCVEANQMETDIGRSDIGTFVFQRGEAA